MTVPYQAAGFHAATPYLRVRQGIEAIEFYRAAFGAEEVLRLMMPDGRLGHAEIRIGDSIIMLSEEFPEMQIVGPQSLGGTTAAIMLYVPHVDETISQAVSHGAVVVSEIKDQFYGDRSGKIRDPHGHEWMIATHIEDVSPEEMKRRMAQEFQ